MKNCDEDNNGEKLMQCGKIDDCYFVVLYFTFITNYNSSEIFQTHLII